MTTIGPRRKSQRLAAAFATLAGALALRPEQLAWGLLGLFAMGVSGGTAVGILLIKSANPAGKGGADFAGPTAPGGPAARMHRHKISPYRQKSGMSYVNAGGGPAGGTGAAAPPVRTAGIGPQGILGGDPIYDVDGQEERAWRRQEEQRRRQPREAAELEALKRRRGGLPPRQGFREQERGGFKGVIAGGFGAGDSAGGGVSGGGGGFSGGAGAGSSGGASGFGRGDDTMVLGNAPIPEVDSGREAAEGDLDAQQRLAADRVGPGGLSDEELGEGGYRHERAVVREGGAGPNAANPDQLNHIYIDPVKAHLVNDGAGPHPGDD